MSKKQKSLLKKQTKTTISKPLSIALNDKEQQMITGGWSRRSSSSSSSSFW